jgi:hypothetical protein
MIWENCELKGLDDMLGKNNIFTGGMCSVSRNQCVEHKMWEQVSVIPIFITLSALFI